MHERHLRRPVRGLRAGDQERALGRGHVHGHQVREQHPHPRRLLHVGAGRLQAPGPRDAAGAEHRHRELLLRGRRHDPVAHQVLAEHGDPAAAHRARSRTCCTRRPATRPTSSTTTAASSPTRSRPARSGSRSTRRRARSRAPSVGFQPCFGGPGTNGGQGATCGTAGGRRTRCWSTRATTRRWSSPRATTAMIQGALEYSQDVTPPDDDDRVLVARRRRATRSTSGSTGSASRRSSTTRPTASTPQEVDCDAPTGRRSATTTRVRAVRARC